MVLVTFNYRLGPLGFLTTDDKSAGGNQGLLDQIMVLNWVKANIGKFGGDPDKVTIFGEDSGAASVTLMAMSPLAKGLFHRAIALSGEPSHHSNISGKLMKYFLKQGRPSVTSTCRTLPWRRAESWPLGWSAPQTRAGTSSTVCRGNHSRRSSQLLSRCL